MPKKNNPINEITKQKLEIAKDIGISRATLYLWKNTRPKLYEIIMRHYQIDENSQNQSQKNK
ncbi:helix-turn-helix domain-containing protein [Campylobacter fetus]|uniref:hypothetical protein n=1 Tax=Campylobacter fetus TaxID=196 RepID=UPI00054EECA2|nr:hypothetical protein [Campylobacter fetus]OCS37983.1 hypothetical protein AWR30_09595 [Campylobacter fetus subsp. venerealis]WKW21820.1 hypothetical protein IXZ14_10945 [Campylobacter fetus subsp. venerealis]WKW23941.1 hypothetical protein IXZ22_11100 [Campylobacter fetus subsp. venerealis]